ncbi:uncharacterized protein METZ01_LOCUS297438 [marine metagenome]|uniref:Peptidase M10 metallopeptidase domain-containing protein n=1 Tax=marine metagenome TaxID=408172 RepID=A0A382M6C4_9ZZZZ
MYRLYRSIIIIVFSCTMFISCGDSSAYNDGKDYYPITQSGKIFHWGKNNTIKINANSRNVTFNSNETNYITSLKAGINEWQDTLTSLGILIVYVSTGADVNVEWVDGSTLNPGILGYASTNKILTMSRTLNKVQSDADNYYHSDFKVKYVATHEFGHMLGIWNHSFDSKDIMYPFVRKTGSLTNRDKKTLTEFLYSQTPTHDMHELKGPLTSSQVNEVTPLAISYFTVNGCSIEIDSDQ